VRQNLHLLFEKAKLKKEIPLSKEEKIQIKQKSGEYYQYLKNEGFVYGDLFANLADQTEAAMKALGINLNGDDN
tara:strand:+ start:157 stop:378 length:222 start_codon:yes stop_codon:yes gene_type:complete